MDRRSRALRTVVAHHVARRLTVRGGGELVEVGQAEQGKKVCVLRRVANRSL